MDITTTTHIEKNVLFLCTGNSCRSHMAQAWCWYYHCTSLNVMAFSAGTAPLPGQPGDINVYAIKAMLEHGIDLRKHRSKHFQDLNHVHFDLVVTVCDDAAQTCPNFQRSNYPLPPLDSNVDHLFVKIHEPRMVHHLFDDPPRLAALLPTTADEEECMQPYRRVCEEVRLFVRDQLPALL
jgi:arsenate reductase